MRFDFYETIRRLKAQGQPFVIATVVWAEKPTSAKPGAKAVIAADGSLSGWIGGSCAEPTVKRQAQMALEDGQARLVRLCPPEKRGLLAQEGVIEVPQVCASGGTLEIFIEPQLVQPQLVIAGHHAVAQALAALGKDLGFDVTVMGLDASPERFPEADQVLDALDFACLELKPDSYIVVASHGNYDEEALAAALQSETAYVALVASKRRAEGLVQVLQESGLAGERLRRLKFPAGLDIGAITPEEIALSILAEIVQLRRMGRKDSPQRMQIGLMEESVRAEARDPVCGMMVEIATARYLSEYMEHTYYFCGKGCQRSFEADPQRYLAVEETHGH